MIRVADVGERGALLRRYRKANGVTLVELAERLGMAVSAVSRRETGHVAMTEAEWLHALALVAAIAEERQGLSIVSKE